MQIPLGSTSQSLDVRIVNDSGIELTGLVAATITSLTWSLAGANADNPFGALNDLASLTTAYNANGVKERGNGIYRLDVPNAVFAHPGIVTIRGSVSGQHVVVPPIEVIANLGLGNAPANTITLTVTDAGSNPLQNAIVTLRSGVAVYTGTTAANGTVTYNLPNGTWSVAIVLQGYSFSGASLVVVGNTTQSYQMTTISVTPSGPGFTTGYFTSYDQNGNPAVGVSVSCVIVQAGGVIGKVYDNVAVTAVSNGSGLVQFMNLALGATYQFTRGTGNPFLVTIPLNAGTTYQLPSIVGNP